MLQAEHTTDEAGKGDSAGGGGGAAETMRRKLHPGDQQVSRDVHSDSGLIGLRLLVVPPAWLGDVLDGAGDLGVVVSLTGDVGL